MALQQTDSLVSFLVQIDLNNNALREDAFWTALIENNKRFADQNEKPRWRIVRVPQYGYAGNLWRELLKALGLDAMREKQ